MFTNVNQRKQSVGKLGRFGLLKTFLFNIEMGLTLDAIVNWHIILRFISRRLCNCLGIEKTTALSQSKLLFIFYLPKSSLLLPFCTLSLYISVRAIVWGYLNYFSKRWVAFLSLSLTLTIIFHNPILNRLVQQPGLNWDNKVSSSSCLLLQSNVLSSS